MAEFEGLEESTSILSLPIAKSAILDMSGEEDDPPALVEGLELRVVTDELLEVELLGGLPRRR